MTRTQPAPVPSHAPGQRIDKFLWFTRLASSRSAAQALAGKGVVRLNGRRIDRAHSPVRVGDLVTLPQGERVRVVRILALPERRGPASEASTCYDELELGQGAVAYSQQRLDADAGPE
ncbi:RNA-binding S4 domain-containing protein [Sphingobium subterraneum]|uniref:Ribosome-associated heat shock protein Hsp15 n=1 Tax=Sphingobium subterraneum TaxID=627688 RepID=A0A841J0M9_9SPHN|nr:RNA-binding S4 domain-containing protein [Sphingobium subterraneum]MBB6124759.1 ribosome-associated heat shock protein Hsp15 [Sphingobium subterraneum]